MEDFCYYLLKSSFVLSLFYIIYYLLLRKETFFKFNRFFLLLGLFSAVFLPLIYITNIVELPTQDISGNANSIDLLNEQDGFDTISPFTIILAFYILGASFFLTRFLFQLITLKRIIKSTIRKDDAGFKHVITTEKVTPFSFFSTIIYNPKLHSQKELDTIISHEEVHVLQKHSYDVLLMEIFTALQWFNPIAWRYSTAIKQNLEFLADTDNKEIKQNKKEYQYVLLKQATGQQNLSIINPFFNSLIKKRIVMINQQKSKKVNLFKSLLIVPLLALFLISFNTNKVYVAEGANLSKNTIEILIDKNTTDAELLKIKKNLAKENFDFSYTTVRNKKMEIQNILLEITGGSKSKGEVSSRFNSASDNDTIDNIYIFLDTKQNSISINNADVKHKVSSSKSDVKNNKEQISIATSSSGDYDFKISKETEKDFKFTTNDEDKEPLFYVDGKKWDSKAVSNLDSSTIESMNVLKGESAKAKYGDEGKNGVIEITLKK